MTTDTQKPAFPMNWEEAVRWLREQADQQALVRDCYFDDPLLKVASRYHSEAEWQAVKMLLPCPPGSALDVGAGRGIASYALANDGWTVTALEPDPSDLVGAGAIRALAKETSMAINIVERWGEQLPFSDASFDVIHARQVLHHAKDLPELCKELFRVLRPGGRLVATREHVISRPEDLPVFLDAHPLHRLYGGENAFSVRQYVRALQGAGFRMAKIFTPFETPINYFPMTYEHIQKAVADILHWPIPQYLPPVLIRIVSRLLNTPGRLYTFVCDRDRE